MGSTTAYAVVGPLTFTLNRALCVFCRNRAGDFYVRRGCALPTSLHAMDRAEIRIGDTVLVLGSGPAGINAVMMALMSGALKVLCIGAPQNRLGAALEAGASAVLDFEKHTEQERLAWVAELTGDRGADVTIEATGSPRGSSGYAIHKGRRASGQLASTQITA